MGKVYNNAISTTGGFQFTSDMPLDDRLVVEKFEDLSSLTKYDGMTVYVKEEKQYYSNIDNKWVAYKPDMLEDIRYKVIEMSSGYDDNYYPSVNAVKDYVEDIVEELNDNKEDNSNKVTSLLGGFNDHTQYPSAKAIQDEIMLPLTEKFENIDTQLESFGKAFKFKGEVDKIDELPTDAQEGDVYQLDDMEYAWNGTEWVKLGFNIDISDKEDKGYKITDTSINPNTYSASNYLSAKVTMYQINEAKDNMSKELDMKTGRLPGLKVATDVFNDGSEIFNDYKNNQALNQYAHAEGSNAIAGCKGFLITNIEKVVEDNLNYYDDNTSIKITLDGDIGKLAVNDVVSIRIFASVGYLRYKADIGAIKEINGNVITVKVAENRHTDDVFQAPNKDKYPNKPDEDMMSYLWVAKKPDIGDSYWFIIQHAEGSGTKAIGEASHAEGGDTIANGEYAHAEGRETIAEYACHAEGRGTKAYGEQSHAEGLNTIAYGTGHAEGIKTISYVRAAHAEGEETEAKGSRAHAEGFYTDALGNNSHAEGSYTVAEGEGAHAEGGYYYDAGQNKTIASTAKGQYSHAEGQGSQAEGLGSHAEGKSKTTGKYAHSEGVNTVASGTGAHAEGYTDRNSFPENAIGHYSHTEGSNNVAEGIASHAEGAETKAKGDNSHTEGVGSQAEGLGSHAEGRSKTTGEYAHSEGVYTVASGTGAHAEGVGSQAEGEGAHAEGKSKTTGEYAHSEGVNTVASGTGAHAEGYTYRASFPENAIGHYSHTEGSNNVAEGINAHAEGLYGKATGDNSHTEGDTCSALNASAHAEGKGSTASGIASHAEGAGTKAKGDYSHTEGSNVIADGLYAHAEGKNTDISYYKENAYGEASHTEGTNNRAYAKNSHVGGSVNIAGVKDSPDTAQNAFVHGGGLSATKYKSQVVFGNNNLEEDNAIFTIGNGYWGYIGNGKNGTIRKNAVTVKQSNPNCDHWSAPKAYMEVESQGTTDKSVVIKKTLDDKVAELAGMFTGSIKKTVISELPATGDENTIYMVGPKVDADGTDYYDEYMFISGKPEMIGNTKTDLSSKMDKFGDYDPNECKLYLTNKNGSVLPFTMYNGNELTVEGDMGVNLKSNYKIGLSGAYTEIDGTHLSLQGRGNTDGNGMLIMGVSTPITEEDIEHYPQYDFMSTGQVPYQAANKKYVDEKTNNSANTVKGTAKGINNLVITDISPIEHNVKIKLENMGENLITDYLSCDFGSTVDYPILGVNYSVDNDGVITASGTPIYYDDENPFLISVPPDVYGGSASIQLEPGATYRFKGLNQQGGRNMFYIPCDIYSPELSTSLGIGGTDYGEGCTFTVPEDDSITYWFISNIEIRESFGAFEDLTFTPALYKVEKLSNTTITITNDVNSNAYKKYYTADENGMVEVKSLSPIMYISTTENNADIYCEYNKDTNIVVEELNNKIDSAKDGILLKDTATGETYKLCITNGKLNVEVVK